MKKLSLAITAVLGVTVSSSAFAMLKLDGGTDSTPKPYAQELSVSVGTVLTDDAAKTGNLDVRTKIGVSKSQDSMYARFDLSNGAKFSSALKSADLTCLKTNGTTACDAASGWTKAASLSSGGRPEDDFAIFEFANTKNTNLILLLDLPGIKLNASKSEVNLTYRVFESQTDSVNPDGKTPMTKKEGTLVKFAPSLEFSVPNSGRNDIDVIKNFLSFTTGDVALVGDFTLKAKGTLDKASKDVTLGKMITADSSLTITSDTAPFLATFDKDSNKPKAGGVYLSTTSKCETGSGATEIPASDFTPDGKKVTIKKIGSDTLNVSNKENVKVCFVANGKTAIPAATLKISLVPSSTADYQIASASYADNKLGEFIRQGTVLEATFTNSAAQTANRFTLSNTGTSEAPITSIQVLKKTGTISVDLSSVKFPTKIPANSVLNIQRDQIPGGKAVFFTIAAPNANIKGTYQLLMTGSNTQSIVQMIDQSGK